jgi:TetR/AcrR family fatty acid metabolism transcriptional regulator
MAKRTSEKYDAILEASIRVIAKHGFHRAQISKIAKEAGVADGTIYLYFENKEDLLISIFQDKIGHFVRKLKYKLSITNDPAKKLFQIVSAHLRYLETHPDLAIVIQMEIRQSNLYIRKKIGELLQEYLTLIEHVMEQGKQSGDFQQNLDTRLARKMIFGTMDDLVTSWVLHQQKYALQEMAKPVYELFVNGITCSRGVIA